QEAGGKLSWAQILFSFEGRISRMQFLIGQVFMLVAFGAVYGAIMLTVNSIFGGADAQTEEATKRLALFGNRFVMILTVPLWWPSWALTLKRLHDLGHGWKALLVFVALEVISAILDLLGQDDASTQVTMFYFGVTFMLAAMKGMTGPNRYG